MVLDEMVYDPGTQEGSVSLSVIQGVFTFVSGEIAKTDPDAMTLDTPVATIGIRGTQLAMSFDPADAGGDGLKVVLMEEAECLRTGGGGEADQVGVEVFEDLTPHAVDGPVALVDDDEVEVLDRNVRVVGDLDGT